MGEHAVVKGQWSLTHSDDKSVRAGIRSDSQLHITKPCMLLGNATKVHFNALDPSHHHNQDTSIIKYHFFHKKFEAHYPSFLNSSSHASSRVAGCRKRESSSIHRYQQNIWLTNGSLKITSSSPNQVPIRMPASCRNLNKATGVHTARPTRSR